MGTGTVFFFPSWFFLMIIAVQSAAPGQPESLPGSRDSDPGIQEEPIWDPGVPALMHSAGRSVRHCPQGSVLTHIIQDGT